jgi:hypothetical protein
MEEMNLMVSSNKKLKLKAVVNSNVELFHQKGWKLYKRSTKINYFDNKDPKQKAPIRNA